MGVHREGNYWSVSIKTHKKIFTSRHKTKEQAAHVYDIKVREMRGEFGRTNFKEAYMNSFRIGHFQDSSLFWHRKTRRWVHRDDSSVYDEEQRTRTPLPALGVWVIIDEPKAGSHHFTTIKLRPVVIRLSATEADYEDLNAQALEFEAALRQWLKGQQILTDGWSVDVITEDE